MEKLKNQRGSWARHLREARKTGRFSEEAKFAVSDWDRCMVGELFPEWRPSTTAKYGYAAHRAVWNNDIEDASKAWRALLRLSAKQKARPEGEVE